MTTVAELIAILGRYPPDKPVRLDVYGHSHNLQAVFQTDCHAVNCSSGEGSEFVMLSATNGDQRWITSYSRYERCVCGHSHQEHPEMWCVSGEKGDRPPYSCSTRGCACQLFHAAPRLTAGEGT